jgi:DNA-binding transcriptional ArsR family regulator
MRHEGVVSSRREAQTMYYSIADHKVAQVICVLYELYCETR